MNDPSWNELIYRLSKMLKSKLPNDFVGSFTVHCRDGLANGIDIQEKLQYIRHDRKSQDAADVK